MRLFPAIDLKSGQVVRLTRGDYEQVKVYSDDPLQVAKEWVAAGCDWLHLVDLDAALEGKPVNFSSVEKIGNWLSSQGKFFQIGGGVRTADHLAAYIEKASASRVILGTVAYQNPDFVVQACRDYPGKIAVGIDVKNGRVATQGWKAVENISAATLAKRFEDVGVSAIVYTDIQRDGMLSGFNFDGIAEFVSKVRLPVVVAGGLKNLEDVKRLLSIGSSQVIGAITGKAIYEGSLRLTEAFQLISASSLT